MSASIQCPTCGSPTSVTETRKVGSQTRRRRACDARSCGKKFSTIEVVIADDVRMLGDVAIVRKRDLESMWKTLGIMIALPGAKP